MQLRQRDSIADCFQSGAPDDQFDSTQIGVACVSHHQHCPLQVSRQVGLFWCRAIAAAEHKNRQTERVLTFLFEGAQYVRGPLTFEKLRSIFELKVTPYFQS